ncbi:MAG: hypothetical protein KDC69_08115 [Flavobacteriaceae bacterium]|nr:hypothetical protein [Flavobacteriaceae bacterium]
MKTNTNHLSRIFEEREYFVEFLIIIIGLGIGLEIFANGIIEFFEISPLYSIFSGTLITIIGVTYIARRLMVHKVLRKDIEGIIFYREEEEKILDTYPYSFCSSLHYCFDSLFNENEAIKRRWEKENLHFGEDNFQNKKFKHYGYSLLIKATQYFLINEISTHLIDYFEKRKLNEKKLINLKREDIPQILFKNEFLELFSKPMNLRPKFEDDEFDDSVVSHYGDGIMYEKFEFTLPQKSNIQIKDDDKLIINTPRFEIEIKTIFEGHGGYDMYSEILKHYFGFKKAKKIVSYNIGFEITVRFNTIALFTKSGWMYYNWVDSLLDWLKDEISFESFCESINWRTINTILRVKKNYDKRKQHGTLR